MHKLAELLMAGVLLFPALHLTAQEKGEFFLGTDMVSRYIWRGINNGGQSAHIQPCAAWTYKNLEVGAWGSFAFSNSYKEYDFYAIYTLGNFGLTVFDFNVPTDEPGVPTTSVELTLSWESDWKVPVYGSISRYVLNDDAAYIGMGVKINSRHQIPMELDLGFTPSESFYAEHAALINVSYTAHYELPVSENFSIPLFSSLTFNPDAEKLYFVAGISLNVPFH